MAATFYTNSPIVFGDDDTVTTVYAAGNQKFPLGLYREDGGKGYRFVKFDNGSGNVASVAGALAYYLPTANNVTSDESDSLAPCGVFAAVIADLGFGWIQVRGNCTVKTIAAGDIIVGDALIETTTDGGVSRISATWYTTTAGTLAQVQRVVKVVGYALAAESASTVAAFLTMA